MTSRLLVGLTPLFLGVGCSDDLELGGGPEGDGRLTADIYTWECTDLGDDLWEGVYAFNVAFEYAPDGVQSRDLPEAGNCTADLSMFPMDAGKAGADIPESEGDPAWATTTNDGPLEELAALGAVAFSDDGDPVEDEALMRRALEIARDLDRPIFPHEEVKALTAGGCMHEGEVSNRLGVKGMPAAGEEQMIARDIELVRQTRGPLHIAHISTAGSVELVRRAKADGLPVTCEVLTHHFVLTDREVETQGTAAKMAPPLRGAEDVAAMCAGLADGTIDIISTDHAPHSAAEKALPLTEAPMGIVGLETAIGLTFRYLVEPGVLTLSEAIARWTCNPARILRLPGGRIAEGQLGDLTILDIDREWTVNPATFRSKSQNTPFGGYRLKGKAAATIIGGQVVYSDFAD